MKTKVHTSFLYCIKDAIEMGMGLISQYGKRVICFTKERLDVFNVSIPANIGQYLKLKQGKFKTKNGDLYSIIANDPKSPDYNPEFSHKLLIHEINGCKYSSRQEHDYQGIPEECTNFFNTIIRASCTIKNTSWSRVKDSK